MRRIIALVLFAVTIASCLIISGCTQQEQPGPADTTPSGGRTVPENVEVVFYHSMGQAYQEILNKYIAKFNETYPTITITHQSLGNYDGVRDQVITELQAGKQPAIAYCYPDHVATYLRSKKVVDLNTYINDPEWGLTEAQKSDFFPLFYNEGSAFGDGSAMYMLPFTRSTEVMYYNKTFFDQHGLSVPDHWFSTGANDTTSLEYVIEKIKEIEPTCTPLGYDSEANWFITMTEQLGTPYTQAADKVEDRFLFDDDKNVEFLNKLRDWYLKGYVTTQKLYGSYTSNLFTNTKPNDDGIVVHAYICIGSSAGAQYQGPAANSDGSYPFEVGIAEIPQANASSKKVISQGPSVCMLAQKDSKVNDAAWLFIKFLLTSPEFQAEFSMQGGYIPVLKSTYELDAYKTYLDDANGYKSGLPALSAKTCREQENNYFTSPAFIGSSDARDQVGELLIAYISADKGTSDADLRQLFKDAYNRCVSLNK